MATRLKIAEKNGRKHEELSLLRSGSLVILLEYGIDMCLYDSQFLLFCLGLAILGIDGCSLLHKRYVFLLQLLHFGDLLHTFFIEIFLCSLVDQNIFFVFFQIFFGITGPDIPIINLACPGVVCYLFLGDSMLLDGIIQQPYFFSQGITAVRQLFI